MEDVTLTAAHGRAAFDRASMRDLPFRTSIQWRHSRPCASSSPREDHHIQHGL